MHVLVIGGGIGGLCLAHGLKKHNISFTVYERDAQKDYRAQGYRIRIAREAVDALAYLFDAETWRLFELTCAETVLQDICEIDATTGRVDLPNLPNNQAMPAGKPTQKGYTVDRTMFREVLLRGLDEHIVWGKSLHKYEETASGIKAHFKDGTSAEGSLVVGADGAHSVVRKQYLPNHPILDTGGRCIYGKTLLTPEVVQSLEPTITKGGMLALKDRSRNPIITMILEPVVFHQRSEMQQAGFRAPESYLYWVLAAQPEVLGLPKDGAPRLTPEKSEELARELAKSWDAKVRPIIACQEPGQTAVLPINSVPTDFGTWQPSGRVTLLGDAVHLMGPTAGSGAITAIRDAELLCRVLVNDGLSQESIGRYESGMRVYASEIVGRSWAAAKYIFGQTSSEDRHIGEVMMANRTGKLK